MHTEKVTSVSSPVYTEKEFLSFLVDQAVENSFSLAAWRLPNSEESFFVASRQVMQLSDDSTIEDLTAGFICAPFDRKESRLFIPADQLVTFKNGVLLETKSAPVDIDAFKHWQSTKKSSTPPRYHISTTQPVPLEKQKYVEVVEKAIAFITNSDVEKVVPSRSKIIDLPADFDCVLTFQKLCKQYPDALISFISIPTIGSWLGATPEVLVTVEDQTIFKTVALAGTQNFTTGSTVKTVAWTQKDIEEQALVERYIISCFKKIRVREYEEQGPKTIIAGNLMHLKSDFTVNLKAINFPQLGSVMLQLLHPTSAVCGMPLDPALAFLKMHEGYDRKFYSGYIGPVNIQNRIDIFVALRCMQLFQTNAALYAGAGVTLDSVPEQEWEETEMKMNTILKIIVG